MFDNLDDPKQQMMLALGLGLLGGKSSNFGNNLSQAGLLGLSTYNQGTQRKAKLEEEAQQKKMRDMQMAQMQRAQEDQAYAAQLAPQFFGAGNAPSDGMGPVAPPKADFAGYGQALMARNPQMGLPWVQAGMKDSTLITMKEGDTLIDRNTFKPLASSPKQKDWMDPRWVETQMALRKAGAPSVSVNTGTQENAFSKEYGKTLAESYGSLMKSDVGAATKLNNLSRLESLLKSSGTTDGAAPTILQMRNVAASFGVQVPETHNFQQAAEALSNQMALELRNPAGGAGMPGALSDKDRVFLTNMTPGIGKTPGSNALIIETQRRLAKRERDVAKMARAYRQKNGRFDEGFYDELARYSEANPLFADLVTPAGAANGNEFKVLGVEGPQ